MKGRVERGLEVSADMGKENGCIVSLDGFELVGKFPYKGWMKEKVLETGLLMSSDSKGELIVKVN